MGRKQKKVENVLTKLSINDKGNDNTSAYVLEGWGITFTDYEDTDFTIMTSFKITNGTKIYEGKTIYDLLTTLDSICKEYDLHDYSKRKKDILVIYTDRLWELSCYLDRYISNAFSYYFQVLDHIEFRQCWDERCVTAESIAEWASNYINNLFVPDKYFYITKSQIFRKRITKTCKKNGVTVGKDIFPDTYELFKYLRMALYGGICYCPYPETMFNQPIIEIDLKSAYIYCFLKKHCVTKGEWVKDLKTWESYINNPMKMSIGTYEITYTSWSNKIKCYKNIDGEACKQTEDGQPVSDVFVMNNRDLKIFLDTAGVTGVKCLDLMEFDLDYLPKEIIDCVVQAYIAKETAKDSTDKKIKKVALNSIYGNTIRKAETRDDWKRQYGKSYLAPQWGTLITSYCKELIIGLGSQLDGWIYSDTDSIFCFDTPENRKAIEQFNAKIRAEVKSICDYYGYDFEPLKNLGTFVIEEEIVKFKAWKQKQYAFTNKDGQITRKAAGCNRDTYFDESIYDMEQVPIGEKVLRKMFINKPVSKEIDGVLYEQPTSYYIIKVNCDNDTTMSLMELFYEVYGDLPY